MFSRNIKYVRNVHIMTLCEKKQNKNWEEGMRVSNVLRESTTWRIFYLNGNFMCNMLRVECTVPFSEYTLDCNASAAFQKERERGGYKTI